MRSLRFFHEAWDFSGRNHLLLAKIFILLMPFYRLSLLVFQFNDYVAILAVLL